MKKKNEYNNLISDIFIWSVIIALMASCTPSKRSYDNSGAACRDYYHKSFKAFNK